jgi:hypothetical protein
MWRDAAAEYIQSAHKIGITMRRVFLSHPFSSAPKRNARVVAELASALAHAGLLPLAPQIYLPQFIDEAAERDLALKLCLALVALSDEVRVYGQVSAGMRLEIDEARRQGITVLDGETGEQFAEKEPPQ